MNINWQWVPNKSLGPIIIDSKISDYFENLNVVRDETSTDSTDWDTYIVPANDVYIDVDGEDVVSITAYREFKYDGKNVIGMTTAQLEKVLGCTPDEVGEAVEYDDGDVKTSFDYFDLGLQIWASDEVITSATCLSYDD